MLSDKDILNYISTKEIQIRPFTRENVNPNSIDLTLGDKITYYKKPNLFRRFLSFIGLMQPFALDTKKGTKKETYDIVIPDEGLIIPPNTFVLATTKEWTKTKGVDTGIAPIIEGKSSLGRLGLKCHITAGFGDDGFEGYWTLELETSQYPVRIYAGMKICQITYTLLSSKPLESYDKTGRYNTKEGENSPIISKGVV